MFVESYKHLGACMLLLIRKCLSMCVKDAKLVGKTASSMGGCCVGGFAYIVIYLILYLYYLGCETCRHYGWLLAVVSSLNTLHRLIL